MDINTIYIYEQKAIVTQVYIKLRIGKTVEAKILYSLYIYIYMLKLLQ
jgi:hypothetical protein